MWNYDNDAKINRTRKQTNDAEKYLKKGGRPLEMTIQKFTML